MDKYFFITTPIYYPSGKPHMGHAYSSIVSDVIARFKRLDGYNVEFLTGTDEHGLKIQRAAEEKGLDPKKFCDELSKTFRNLSKTLNLSNTDFIRTTEDRHIKSVQNLWKILEKNDQIYLSKYSGWYSVSDEAFYNDDEIKEENGINISVISGSKVEWVEEESYFFKLSSWSDKLLKHYKDNENFILPNSRKNEVINFVKKGLKDLSVSRTSFTWGIPVPRISCRWRENERAMFDDMAVSAAEMLEVAGVRNVQVFHEDNPPGKTIHEMGTARMGRDPSTSVLNAYNQAHDVRNLFVIDGSCMVSSANQNPSLTYMALTARACAYAVDALNRMEL